MHDEQWVTEQQGMEVGDFHTVVNAFTEGLRELPTDYAARVKNFLAEYLGSPRHPVPFGGRVRDFEQLDAWFADQEAPPYLLLAAPASAQRIVLLRQRTRGVHCPPSYTIWSMAQPAP